MKSWTALHGDHWHEDVCWHGFDGWRCAWCAPEADASRMRCIERAGGGGKVTKR